MSKSVVSVASYLETLEDTRFTNKSLSTGLISLNSLLQQNDTRVTPQEAVRILAVLEKCLKEDVKSLPYGLSAVLSLLSNAKAISKLSTEDLLPSALAVIKMLGVFARADNVRYLGVQVILKYPTDVLCHSVRFHINDVIKIFEVFKEPNFQSREGINKMAYYLLKELLYKMPLPEKKLFLGEGLRTWFGDFIPLVISPYTGNSEFHVVYMELLEKLAEDLEVLDYTKHLVWKQKFLSSVCDSQKFPSFIKSHLTNNSEVWHRMWIVLVKLLKLQVTQQCSYGTPIQAMLGVVESGFKVDTHKVRAFQCWDTLIDILSTDTSPKCLRYIKLLLIPMRVNNAKTPPTLEAKFHTWWKLLHKFQNRFEQFREEVVISFINFMFGKSEKCKPSQIPVVCEQSNLRHLCLQAFVQIVGHENTCNCCSDLPNSINKFLNKKMLMNYFEHWMHALKNAIITTHYVMSREDNEAHGESMQVLCIWTAFLKLIAELPPNGVRNDLFNELLNVLLGLVRNEMEGINKNTLSSIIFSLVLSLAEKDLNVKDMLSQGRIDDDPLHKIIPIILHPQMADIYRGYGMRKMVEMLKPLTDMFVESKNIECLVRSLMQSKNTSSAITIWTAVADTVNAKQDIGSKLLTQILIWPIRASSKPDFIMDQHSSTIWSTVYRVHAKNDTVSEVDKEIFEFVSAEPNGQSDKDYFNLVVTVSVLNLRLVRNQVPNLKPTLVKLKQLTTSMVEYNEYELIMPVLSDTLVLLLNIITTQKNKYKDLLNDALDCVKHVVNLISKERNTENCIIPFMLNKLTAALKVMLEDPEYKQPINKFLDSIGNLSLQGQIHSDTSPNTTVPNTKDYNIDTRIEAQDTSNKTTDLGANVKEFTSPKVKAKKQASSIVKTFVENGEEYVVVKSNWRFNPRKLTENQKEKLQRKREDIPALYQDLSQSQDEFKLKSWKTDSQDTITSTSASNSKSTKSNQTAKEDASNILKTISSFDVVPNIMKNMMNENDKNQTTDSDVINTEPHVLTNNKSNKIQPVTPKNSKSPRMAFKDRVLRNVGILIEKSSPNNNVSKNVAECLDNVVPITPPSVEQINNVNLIQSAPSQIPTDRPSRMKRKPKKFDDTQLFGLKKRRYSHTDSIPDLEVQNDIACNTELTNNKEITSDEDKNNSEDDKDTRKNLVSENYSTTSDNRSKGSSTTTDVFSQDTQKNADVLITVNVESISADKAVSLNDFTGDICDHEMESLVENNVQSTDSNVQMKNQDKNNKELSETIHILDSQESQTNTKETDKNSGNPNVELCDEEISVSHKDQIKSGSKSDKSSKSNSDTEKNNNKEVDVPKTPVSKTKENIVKSSSTSKKSTKRKSRLEKELAIDMVEGHPFLKINSDKRVTRKTLVGTETTGKRKSVTEDGIKTKTPSKSSPKSSKKLKETNKSSPSSSQSSITVEETQEKNTPSEEPPCSEDIIESSQDSTFTTISVKSTRRTVRVPVITVEKLVNIKHITETQCLLQDSVNEVVCETDINKSANQDSRDDIELPQNKTAEVDKDMFELTENLDTEPVAHEKISDDVIVINDENTPITLSSDNHIGQETLELAEADTQPNNPADFAEFESHKQSQTQNLVENEEITNTAMDVTEPMTPNSFPSQHTPNTQEDASKVTTESQCSSKSKSNCVELDTGVCSPFKDDAERKQDFLNNTSEISPIKMQRPDEEKSPEEQAETSSDYMVVRLSSPVHSNGEPYHSGSPEFFTVDKVSPDKRDQSPPRVEASTSSSSPSSSLSLKKNKPQAKRAGGRAAQMLGLLCIPDSLKHSDRTEPEEPKKVATSTPARRNLRVLYNAVEDNVEHNLEEEEQTNFLKLKKSLPSIDSSPSVPILKRKLIIDESNGSPAGKRKRVSFHDPPVSTTVSVHKYIEPTLIRSPSSSHKRQAIRSTIKSPKRLDTAFKLDTVLSKALESFSEPTDSLSNDTYTSLEVTPSVEVVNTSELNDTDPICPALIDCNDPISNIALELSSPTMKDLLIKELEGKVGTIGDLAKMTELEVNRLCIKAPKVQIAKKVLTDYAFNRIDAEDVIVTEDKLIEDETAIATEMDDEMTEPETKVATTDTQTEIVKTCDMDAQTESRVVKPVATQTLKVPNEDVSVQTVESGSKSTSEIISSCLAERPDFIERLCEFLPTEKLVEMFAKQSNFNQLLGQVLDHRNQQTDSEKTTTDMDFFKNFLCQRFGSKDLIRFCSRVLDSVHDKLD